MSPGQIEAFKETRLSSLKASGYPVLGLLPRDRALATVTLGELVKLLGAKPVNEHNGLDHLVENVMVGSHGIDPGIYYYGQREKKVVIVRSDRPDMQLAALRTPTLALILAGERRTYDEVLFHAEQNKIPIFSLPGKTLDAVEKMGDVLKPTPFRQVKKVEIVEQLLRENCDLRDIIS
jgi:BioD-like phosphotransacetylase family protein